MTEEVTREEIAAAQRAVMIEDGCGLTIEGERTFCDDPRAIEPTIICDCKRAGKAAALAAAQSRPTKGAAPSASGLTNTALRAFWKSQGGGFHGPHVETGDMAEAKLLPLLRSLLTPSASGRGMVAAVDEIVRCLRGWARAYRNETTAQYRFPSDPDAEVFPVDLEQAATLIEQLASAPAPAPDNGSDDDRYAGAVDAMRDWAKTGLGFNCTFVDDDMKVIVGLAQRAVLAGLASDFSSDMQRCFSEASERERATHEKSLGRPLPPPPAQGGEK